MQHICNLLLQLLLLDCGVDDCADDEVAGDCGMFLAAMDVVAMSCHGGNNFLGIFETRKDVTRATDKQFFPSRKS